MYKYVLDLTKVIPTYCTSPPAPTPPVILNANVPTPSTALGSSTYFTCNWGFVSSGDTAPPYFLCLASTAAAGTWSTTSWGCSCTYFVQ